MIDEELYRIAQEELNSDQRRSNIWARACALARDDHDEARYLYTNLRVEEMVAEQKASGKPDLPENDPAPEPEEKPASDKPRIRLDPAVMAQANEMIADDRSEDLRLESSSLADSDFGDLDADAMEQFSSRLNAEVKDEPKQNKLSDETANALEKLAESKRNMTSADLESSGKDDKLDFRQRNEADPTKSSGIDQYTSIELELPNTDAAEEQFGLDELDIDEYSSDHIQSTDEPAAGVPNIESEQPSTPVHRDAHPVDHVEQPEVLAQEELAALEAQARREASVAEQPVAARTMESVPDQSNRDELGPGVNHDYADNSDINAAALEQEIDADEVAALDSGSGKPFLVFSDSEGRTKVVKRGVSWSAMFLTFPWLLSKSLFGTALVYALLWLVLMGGLLLTGLAWLDAGAAVSTATKLATALFALLIVIGLLYLPFRYGNSWVAQKLINKRYDYHTPVRAKNSKHAIDKVLRFAA